MKKQNEGRSVIIYLPNGNEMKYTTSEEMASTNEYSLVEVIEAEPDRVNIAWKEDGRFETESFVMIPYIFNLWK